MERRDFIKASLSGLATAILSASLSVSMPKRAHAATIEYFISAQEVLKPVLGSSEILTWQFVDASASPLGMLRSNIVVNEGDVVIVHLTNNIPSYPINLKIPGLLDSTLVVDPGVTQTFQFVATQAGSYVYFDDQNGELGRAMGLAGPLIVFPTNNSNALYTNAPLQHQFNRHYVLMFQEFDSRINNAVRAGLPVDMNTFQPEYFVVNGLSYPDTVYDAGGKIDDSKVIFMQANEQVALRFINGGLIYYPMHFHGYHTNVVMRNRALEQTVISKDVVLVKTAECVDSILNVGSQVGLYPLHTHYVPGVTTFGRYAGGGLLIMKAV